MLKLYLLIFLIFSINLKSIEKNNFEIDFIKKNIVDKNQIDSSFIPFEKSPEFLMFNLQNYNNQLKELKKLSQDGKVIIKFFVTKDSMYFENAIIDFSDNYLFNKKTLETVKQLYRNKSKYQNLFSKLKGYVVDDWFKQTYYYKNELIE